jgi:acetyl esterase/lipase
MAGVNNAPDTRTRVTYGPHPDQFVDVSTPVGVPQDALRDLPVIALLHGGYWRDRFTLSLMADLAASLTGHGFMVWNVEYRRVPPQGNPPGAWLDTVGDIVAAVETLCARYEVSSSAVTLIGHSAGGQLALLTAPQTRPRGVVALAPVTDMVVAAAEGHGEGAVLDFIGVPLSRGVAEYRAATPTDHLPLGCRQFVVHGDADDRVPLLLTRQYMSVARAAGDDVTAHIEPAGDHFFVLDPGQPFWRDVLAWIR